jgi:RNA polymerase sigma factor (sigma-70 family)
MAARPNVLLRFIQGMAAPPGRNETSDAVLVNRFIAGRDDHAFSALVDRYGALVLQTCRRILGDCDDADDAFQATFLVLARKAQSVRSLESLAGWLHGVARRASLKARALRARRLRLEMAAQLPPVPRSDPLEDLSSRELLSIVEEEIESLPEKQRLPILLCCLEGMSLEESAERLGWKPGAVKGRLQRGRRRLHERLVRRGLTLSAALAAVEASRAPASAAVIARLAAAASRGALARAASRAPSAEGISAGAAALAPAVLRDMAWTKLSIAAGLLLTMCLLAVGLTVRGTEQPPSTERFKTEFAPLPALAAVIDEKHTDGADDDDARIEANGRVLDPTGKPYAGANLYVGYAVSGGGFDLSSPQTVLPLRTKSGADGRFQFTFSRSELDARMLDDSRPAVIAVASDYGPEWSQIAGPGQTGMLALRLVEDFPLNGRILDSRGKPVAGAKIRVLNIDSDSEENIARLLGRLTTSNDHRRRWRGSFPERPPEAIADTDGRFRLTGLGRDRIAMLVQDEPVSPQGFSPVSPQGVIYAIARPTDTGPNAQYRGATFDVVASDTRLVRGVCRDQASGKPVAGVRMSVLTSRSGGRFTDVNGRFELPVASDILASREAAMCIVAEPEGGQPYFTASALAPRTAGSEPIAMDFNLVRGIPVAGKIQNPRGKKPPSLGRVDYYPLNPNLHAARIQAGCSMPGSSGLIQPDGSYQLVVLPGPGAIAVAASPRRSFAAAVVDNQVLAGFSPFAKVRKDDQGIASIVGTRSGCFSPKSYNAIALINPDERAQSLALDVEVRTAVRLRGLLSDPNGQPLAGVSVLGLTPRPWAAEIVEGPSFELTEMAPGEVREVVFMHLEKKLVACPD